MKRFVEGEDRRQGALLPHCLDDYVTENNPVRVIEAFIDELDLAPLGFDGVVPETTGRPAYHPATLLKIYLYGYLNRVQSSRRLEREAQRNIELMWLTGRLAPDFKTIADFRKDNGPAIRATCRQFVMLCRRLDLFSETVIAIDGSRFGCEHSGQELHARCDRASYGAGRSQYRTLLIGTGHSRSARGRGRRSQIDSAKGQARPPEATDAAPARDGDRSRRARSADLADRIQMLAQWRPAAKAPASSAT